MSVHKLCFSLQTDTEAVTPPPPEAQNLCLPEVVFLPYITLRDYKFFRITTADIHTNIFLLKVIKFTSVQVFIQFQKSGSNQLGETISMWIFGIKGEEITRTNTGRGAGDGRDAVT